MKGRNFSKKIQRIKYIVTDYVLVSVAFFIFNIFRYYTLVKSFNTLCDYLWSENLVLEQLFIPVCLLCIYWLSGYYNKPFDKSRLSEFNITFWSVVASTVFIYLLLLINDSTGVKTRDYHMILVLFGLMFIFTYAGRLILSYITMMHLRLLRWIYSTLIIGNSETSREVYHRLKEAGSVWAYDVVGFIKIDGEHSVEDGLPSWQWADVERVCQEKKVDQIILAPERIRNAQIIFFLSRLFPLNKPVKIAPDTLSYITGNIHLNDILGIPFIDLTSPRMSQFQCNVKRSFDILVSAIALVALSPVMACISIAVKRVSSGPIIYKQQRMGRGRKPFYIYKFRTMKEDAEKDGPRLSSDNDDRITRVGYYLRKYRLDELPQFWNVIKGHMSLVGPRPEREFFISQIVKKAPYYGLIFQVRPGITSWGMVKYGYASSVEEMVKRAKYDLVYLNNMSISNDIKILIYTVRTVVKGVGK